MHFAKVIIKNNGYLLAAITIGIAALLVYIAVNVSQYTNKAIVQNNLTYYVDKESILSIDDYGKVQDKRHVDTASVNFGIVNTPHWFEFTITPNTRDSARLLEISYSLLNEVDVWYYDTSETISSQTALFHFSGGDQYLFEQRMIQHDNFLYPIPDYSHSITVVIRVKTSGTMKLPLSIWHENDYIEYNGAHKLFIGLFFGYMFAMAVSNLFLCVATRNTTFVVYSVYVTSFALIIATLHGVGYQFLWPNNAWFQDKGITVTANVMLASILLFSNKVLDIKTSSAICYAILNWIMRLYITLALISLFAPYSIMLKTVLFAILITVPIMIGIGIRLVCKGSHTAKYFCAAWIVLMVGCTAVVVDNVNIATLPIDIGYLLMVGASVETLLLMMAFAMSFGQQKRTMSRVSKLALLNERDALEAKDELVRLQERSQEDLEYKVQERTLELEIALRELSEANNELERISAIDPLTGLMNRRFLEKRFLAEVRRSRREQTELSVVIIDIDHFKNVNDTYGHVAGDDCLTVFARLLEQVIKRPGDLVCRYGGEEFFIILPNTNSEGALILIEKVREIVQTTLIESEQFTISITASAGISSTIVQSEDDQKRLMQHADKLLYKAKESGRNRVFAENLRDS